MTITRLLTREPLSEDAADVGDNITISDVNALTAIPVTPANVAPDPADVGGVKRSVPINQWYEVPFQMNDKELLEVERGFLPRIAEQAVIALANQVEGWIILELLKGIPYAVGTPGTAPFQTDLDEFFEASILLDEKNVPGSQRGVMLNPRAYNNALRTRALQDASWRGSNRTMETRQILTALGAQWEQTNSIKTRTQGTGTGYLLAGAVAKGAREFTVDTGTGTWLPGDTFTVAGDNEPYSVVSFSGGILEVSPAVRVALADNSAITRVAANGVPNFLIHPNAFAFVNRPLAQNSILRQAGGVFETVTDPESGLTFRLELLREHKRVRWSIDMLWGGGVLNAEFGARIYG
jgi:hypothetical protein